MEKSLNDNLAESMNKVDDDALDMAIEELKKIKAELDAKK